MLGALALPADLALGASAPSSWALACGVFAPVKLMWDRRQEHPGLQSACHFFKVGASLDGVTLHLDTSTRTAGARLCSVQWRQMDLQQLDLQRGLTSWCLRLAGALRW